MCFMGQLPEGDGPIKSSRLLHGPRPPPHIGRREDGGRSENVRDRVSREGRFRRTQDNPLNVQTDHSTLSISVERPGNK